MDTHEYCIEREERALRQRDALRALLETRCDCGGEPLTTEEISAALDAARESTLYGGHEIAWECDIHAWRWKCECGALDSGCDGPEGLNASAASHWRSLSAAATKGRHDQR